MSLANFLRVPRDVALGIWHLPADLRSLRRLLDGLHDGRWRAADEDMLDHYVLGVRARRYLASSSARSPVVRDEVAVHEPLADHASGQACHLVDGIGVPDVDGDRRTRRRSAAGASG